MTTTRAPILIGYVDSEGAHTALEWAALEALRRRIPLAIVYAADFVPVSPTLHVFDEFPDPALQAGRQHALQLVEAAAETAQRFAPGIEVSATFTEAERPVDTLVRESGSAAMVVLGSRRLGPLGSTFLGSVGAAVSQRALCPVIVVRGPAGNAGEGARVVVGVDGHGPADALLEFAFDHASASGRPIEVILCWPLDTLAEMSWRPPAPAPEHADALVAEIVAGWREKYPDVIVHTGVIRNHPAAGLVAASTAQDLLVVGRHGRHVLGALTLGSTSTAVLHHATCPVAVIPEP